MDELGPLRARSAQLHAAAAREKAGALHTYETSARPALREQAASLKESLAILMREEAALREKLEGLAQRAVEGADPGVRTGFNVIRSSRTSANGRELSIEVRRGVAAGAWRVLTAAAAAGGVGCMLLHVWLPLHAAVPSLERSSRAVLPPPLGPAGAAGGAAAAG